MEINKDKFNKFSISLGLLDYVNPIFYSVTIITIIKSFYSDMGIPYNIILLIGAIISILFGFTIPTIKVLVGLNIIKFKMPVSLVFSVNTGILLSGIILFNYVIDFNILILILMLLILIGLLVLYIIKKNVNTIAVLTGAFGYLMLYISLIISSIRVNLIFPIVLYGLAIILFVMLCFIGIKANLKDPRIHWIIEISNVLCQALVCIGTLLLF